MKRKWTPEQEKALRWAAKIVAMGDLMKATERKELYKKVDEIKKELGINKLGDAVTWQGKIL